MENNKTAQAVKPESRKSMGDLYTSTKSDVPKEVDPIKPVKSIVELQRESSRKNNQELVESLTPNYELEAERASKDNLIGGFNFNYEYMPGENYISDDLKEIQAQRQPGVDKLKRGLTRFAGEFALNVLETPGVLGGAIASAVTGDINNMTNNFWVNASEAMKKQLQEANPVYSSKAVRDGGVWDKMSSGEWIATEGASALAFMASALVPGLAISKGAKSLGLVRMLAGGGKTTQAGLAAVDKASKALGLADEAAVGLGAATGDMGSLITTTLANTVFESGIEAMGAQKSFQSQLDQKFQTGQINQKDYLEYSKHADEVAAKVFNRNMILLAGPNMLMSKMILGPTANTLEKAHKNIHLSKAGRWVKGGFKEAPTTKVGKFLDKGAVQAVGKMGKGFAKNTFREGVVEEMGQMSIEKYYTDEYIDALESGKDERFWADSYARILGSTDGQVAALTGGIISGPLSMRQRYLEGKAIRKTTDELVNNYNGVSNYYSALRDNIYETDKEGNLVMEMVDADGNPVETGGKLKPKVDTTKVAEIAAAHDEVNKLRAAQTRALEDGNLVQASQYAARLQAGAFAPFLRMGEPGLKALQDMMTASPATKMAVDLLNKENGTELTVEKYVADQMDTANKVYKEMQHYDYAVVRPNSSKWERANDINPATEDGKYAAKLRDLFNLNSKQAYVEAKAVVFDLLKQQKEITTQIADSEASGAHDDVLQYLRGEELKITNALNATNRVTLEMQDYDKNAKRWDTFYKTRKKAEDINSGKIVYDLNDVITRAKSAKNAAELGKVVEDALERGLLVPEADKSKLPLDLVNLLQSEEAEDLQAGLAILDQHINVDKEFLFKGAQRLAAVRGRGTSQEDLEAFEERDEQYKEALATQDTKPEYTGDGEEIETETEEIQESYRGIPIVLTNEIVNREGKKGAASFGDGVIKLDREFLQQKFKEKAWTKSRDLKEVLNGVETISSSTPLPEDAFQTYEEFEKFVLEHEYQHSQYTKKQFNADTNNTGTRGEYEDAINQRALEALNMKQDFSSKVIKELKGLDIRRIDKTDADTTTLAWLTTSTTMDTYYAKVAELMNQFHEGKATPDVIDQLFLVVKTDPIVGDMIVKNLPKFNQEMAKRGTTEALKKLDGLMQFKPFTEDNVVDEVIKRIDTGYDVPSGISAELLKVFQAARKALSARQLQSRIDEFNRIAKERGRLWRDIVADGGLIKAGTTVYWRGSDGTHHTGTAKSIISALDSNGSNLVIEGSNGKLYIVNVAAIHLKSTDTNVNNQSRNTAHKANKDTEARTLERSDASYVRIGVRGNEHKQSRESYVSNKGGKDGDYVLAYNAFLQYLEEPRDKRQDQLTFLFNKTILDSLRRSETATEEEKKALNNVLFVFEKLKAGLVVSEEELELFIAHMPMNIRIKRLDGQAGAHAVLPYKKVLSTDPDFDAGPLQLRRAIINTWLTESRALSKGHDLLGVTANWAFQYTGELNVDSNHPQDGNSIAKLRGVTVENIKLFAVSSKESGEIITKIGDKARVPSNLINETGGIFITVKDNTGEDFNLRVRNTTMAGSVELEAAMMVIEDVMNGVGRLDQPLSKEIQELLDRKLPRLSAALGENTTYGVLYNTLIYSGVESSHLAVSLDPISKTFTIGNDTWDAKEFNDNINVVTSMLGLKYKNVNFPSGDITKNKLPSTKDLKYLSYIIEDKVISTNIKEDSPIFVGKESADNSTMMESINPFLSPREVKGAKIKEVEATKTVKPKEVKTDAPKLGSKLVEKLKRAGYSPSNLSAEALTFLEKVKGETVNVIKQSIEDYNNRVIAAEEKSDDHVIKKCKG